MVGKYWDCKIIRQFSDFIAIGLLKLLTVICRNKCSVLFRRSHSVSSCNLRKPFRVPSVVQWWKPCVESRIELPSTGWARFSLIQNRPKLASIWTPSEKYFFFLTLVARYAVVSVVFCWSSFARFSILSERASPLCAWLIPIRFHVWQTQQLKWFIKQDFYFP